MRIRCQLAKQAKKFCIIEGIEDTLNFWKSSMSIRNDMRDDMYNNFNFDADRKQLYPCNKLVSKLKSVKNAFRIHRHSLI